MDTVTNGDKVLRFLTEQRKEDRQLEKDRHEEVLKMIRDNRELVMSKINDHCMNTEISFKRHDKYHKDNEHRWGVFKFVRDNALKVVIIAFTLGTIFAGTISLTYKDIIKELIKLAK